MRPVFDPRGVGAALAFVLLCGAPTMAQPLAMTAPADFPATVFEPVLTRPLPAAVPRPDVGATDEPSAALPSHLRRQVVLYPTTEAPGTIIIDVPNTYLYFVLGQGRAIRYGIGVGRDGFNWSGVRHVSQKQEWPDWHPPAEMIARQPYLPRFMGGGPGNPLGARALYLGGTLYRIHGTNDPSSIGQRVSSGCFRLLNEDVIDLYDRVPIGAKVVVLPDRGGPAVSHEWARRPRAAAAATAMRPTGSPSPRPAPMRANEPHSRAAAPSPALAAPLLHYGASASRLY